MASETVVRAHEANEATHYHHDGEVMRLEVPHVTWWRHSGLIRLYAMMPIFFLGSTLTGYDGSLLNGLQTMEPWQDYFGHPSGGALGFLSAIQVIGGACAVVISPYAADLLGRRLAVVIGVVVVFIGTIIQVVPSTTYGMFLGGRFLVGFGYLGSIVAAWTVFGTVKYTSNASWRIPVGLQAMMPFMQFVLIWITPESPRWLCSKDRMDEAYAILTKYHANGDATDPFVQAEFLEIQETLRLEKEQANSGWLDLLKTPGNRKRVLIIVLTAFFSQCSGNGLVSYYLHDILDSVGVSSSYDQSLINGGLQIWNVLICVGMAFAVDKVGRRPLFLASAIGMLLSFSVWIGCSAVYADSNNQGAGKAVIAMIFIFFGLMGLAFPGLTVAYPMEILPYNLRAKGLGLLFASANASSFINQYLNPIGIQRLKWKFYFVYLVILVIEVLCIYFIYPETKGPTLEEMSYIFDGEDAATANINLANIKGGTLVEHAEAV